MAFGQTPAPFGQTSSSFSFGQAASNPSPFGASSTPAFGAPNTPAFGAPASSTPSLFGASSTPAFGASASPSPFGTPSTPAFGTPQTTPSLFGASSAAAASAANTFSFSIPASSSAAASSASGFGSLFGASTSTSAAAPGSFFGQQPAAGGGAFGTLTTTQQPQPQPGTQLSPLAYSSGGLETIKRELEAVATAYMPNHANFKFQHLFLNVVENPGQRVKPPQVLDELSWKQALRDAGGPDNPDKLWPVHASGFEDLLKRGQAQAAAADENRRRLDELKGLAHKLAQRQTTEIALRVSAAREKHLELSNRLLAVARHVDALEGRLASYMGMRGELSRGKEAALSRALEVVEAQLSHTSPAGLQRRLDALAAACRLRGHSGLSAHSDGGATQLDEASLQQLFGVLREHVEGLKQLQEVLRRDVLDVEILRGVRQDSSVPAAMNIAAIEYI